MSFWKRVTTQLNKDVVISNEVGPDRNSVDEINRLKYFLGVFGWPEVTSNDLLAASKLQSFADPKDFWAKIKLEIRGLGAKSALDIGCGVRPFNLHRFETHVCLEPYKPYADSLNQKFLCDPSIVVLNGSAPESLRLFPDKSFDSVLLLDVLEHMTRESGFKVLEEAKRLARISVHVFTPQGFMPQHVGPTDDDGWGFIGNELQTHVSGWDVEDFDGWKVTIGENYHSTDDGQFNALWASLDLRSTLSPRRIANLYLTEPLGADSEADYCLKGLAQKMSFGETYVHPELAPWSFRTIPPIWFPRYNAQILGPEELPRLLTNGVGNVPSVIFGSKNDLALLKVEPQGKVLLLLTDSAQDETLIAEWPNQMRVKTISSFSHQDDLDWMFD